MGRLMIDTSATKISAAVIFAKIVEAMSGAPATP